MTQKETELLNENSFLKMERDSLAKANEALQRHTYAAPHVWNLVAKQIRESYPKERSITDGDMIAKMEGRRILEDLALAFAKRFTEDEGFDPVAWLDKCSPDTDLYPLSELWGEANV